MMRLKIRELRVDIEFLPLAAICLVCLLYEPRIVAICLASAIIHELGHIAAALLCRVKGIKVRAEVFSFRIDGASVNFLCFWKNIFVLTGGIAANSTLVLFSFLLSRVYDSELLPIIFCINLSQQIMNMLPIRPLDGGNIAELVLLRLMPYDRALSVMETAERLLLALLLIAIVAWFVLCKSFNLTLALLWLVLCFSRLQALHLRA